VTFADVLDAELGTHAAAPPLRSRSSDRPITPPLFLFGDPRFHFRPIPIAPVHHSIAARPAPRPGPATRLKPHEQLALAALNRLGADLADNISSSELRRAFRRLARRYHPDRHPGSTKAEQQRLSRLFTELTTQYRLLAAALDAGATLPATGR